MTKHYSCSFKMAQLFSFKAAARSCLIWLMSALLSNVVYAQRAGKDLIESKFDDWRKNNLQEKIYLHTDKANYITGEICWFKVYNVNAYNHQPIDFGKVAYVEVLDRNSHAVLQAKIGLTRGAGDGSFYLPATLASGNYKIRAYTNWMKNNGADYFFEKKLAIINIQKNTAEKAIAKPLYDIGFFPEGGNLVDGIESKVGFKVNDQWGTGVQFEGLLLNEKGDTIISFRPLKFGMGSFTFTPAAGTQYRAVVKLPGGDQQVKTLPPAYKTGYTMHLENRANGQLAIKVQTNEPANGNPVFLFAQTRNVVKIFSTIVIQNGRADFVTDAEQLEDGISQFTVFNSGREPVCERLYFKQPKQPLHITTVLDKTQYGLRKKVNIDISTTRQLREGLVANMSLAVYRLDDLAQPDLCGIDTYLLLQSDIAGHIESPAYYFTAGSDTVPVAADNLMLTQGWRRFRWNDVMQAKKTVARFVPEIYGHIISGKLVPLRSGLSVKDIPVYLTVPGIRTQFQSAAADESGKIKFDMKDLYSDGDIIVQTNNEKDSGYRIEIDTPFISSFSQKPLANYAAALPGETLLNNYIASQVQNTFLYKQLNHATQNLPDTNAFYSKPGGAYLLDNYVRFTTLEEVFREYVVEVGVRKRGGRFYLPMYDAGAKGFFLNDPLLLLDGLPVFNLDKAMSYDPLKIRKLEVVNQKYFLRDNSFDGIINLTTYKGDLEGFEIDPRATIVNYEGLQVQRDFYAPVYATEQQQHSRMPDFRNLLYWAPEINTGEDGKTKASFYTSDIPGKYAVVTEGISKEGSAGESIVYFEVKK